MHTCYLYGLEPCSKPHKRWKTQLYNLQSMKSHTGASITSLVWHYCVTQSCHDWGHLGVAEITGGFTSFLVDGIEIFEAFADGFFDIGFTCGEQVPYRP